MTSAEFSPAPFAVPTAATPDAAAATNNAAPGVTLPNLEYTLYQPKQLKSRIPALMIHGFATRGEQLYGGTGWIRQYLRAGSPELPAGNPGAHPHAPIAVVLGDADTIAADGAELYDMVREDNPLNRFIPLPGRDHVNALTSGVFRRGALAFAAEAEATEATEGTGEATDPS